MQTVNLSPIKYAIMGLCMSYGTAASAFSETFDIPTLGAIKIFAQEIQLPAVVNYYTNASESEIINFYQTNYGEIEKQESKRGRLVLYFTLDKRQIRVIISQQNNKRQVDIIAQ